MRQNSRWLEENASKTWFSAVLHKVHKMHLINQQPWINLDPFIDCSKFESVQDRITVAVARATKYAVMGRVGSQLNMLDQYAIEATDFLKHIIENPLHPEHEFLMHSEMDRFEMYSYLKYKYPLDYFGEVIQVRDMIEPNNFPNKHLLSHTKFYPAAIYFNDLRRWLMNSAIFSETGRIVVMLCSPGWRTPIHTDYQTSQSRHEQFLWINPYQSKKLFVYDELTYTKHPITSTFSYFDNANYHGTEVQTKNCYSIRVDGVFSKEFLEKTNMYKHFRGQHD